jgi:hypothetical protein
VQPARPSPGLAIDHLKLKTKFVRHTIQKLLAVFGRPAGFGCNQARAGNALVFHFITADGQGRHRAADRGLAQATRRRDALAEPYNPGKCVYDAKAFA